MCGIVRRVSSCSQLPIVIAVIIKIALFFAENKKTPNGNRKSTIESRVLTKTKKRKTFKRTDYTCGTSEPFFVLSRHQKKIFILTHTAIGYANEY